TKCIILSPFLTESSGELAAEFSTITTTDEPQLSGKECLLYGTPPSNSGIFQTAITSVFKITDEYRVSKPDTRYQIRMSAIQYSQRENHLTDLLSPFSSDPRRRTVRVVDDPRAGALLEKRIRNSGRFARFSSILLEYSRRS
ncbi:hypothetical protein COOONC_20419, partial [Cooperia oncophora]